MSVFSTARLKMVDGQVRTSDVTDRRVLDAMLTVPREAFVPASRQALAYLDLDLDVSEGGAKRFLIKPQLTGKLLQAAEIGEDDDVAGRRLRHGLSRCADRQARAQSHRDGMRFGPGGKGQRRLRRPRVGQRGLQGRGLHRG
ncbi:hypothetical protein ACVWZK_005661 [Bradyrhizobium sp. GM0.4]